VNASTIEADGGAGNRQAILLERKEKRQREAAAGRLSGDPDVFGLKAFQQAVVHGERILGGSRKWMFRREAIVVAECGVSQPFGEAGYEAALARSVDSSQRVDHAVLGALHVYFRNSGRMVSGVGVPSFLPCTA